MALDPNEVKDAIKDLIIAGTIKIVVVLDPVSAKAGTGPITKTTVIIDGTPYVQAL